MRSAPTNNALVAGVVLRSAPPPILLIDAGPENRRLCLQRETIAALPRDGFRRWTPSLSERICPFCYERFDHGQRQAVREACCPARVCAACNDRYRCNVCPFCEKIVARRRRWLSKQATMPRQHTCPYESCSMAFQKPCALARHLRRHTGEKPYVCRYEGCGKAFSEKGNMNRHHNDVHRCERPFACDRDGCLQRFARKSHLEAHRSSQHP